MKPTKDLGPERVGLKPTRGWGDICRFRDTFLGNIRRPGHVAECLMPSWCLPILYSEWKQIFNDRIYST